MCDYRWGFGLDIGFIEHLCTKLGTTSIIAPSLISTLHKSPHAKSSPTCCVFNSRSLVTASNSGDSAASALKSSLNGGSLSTVPFLHGLPYRTDLVALVVFLIPTRHGPCRQHFSFSYPLLRECVYQAVP
jgi:hypothetical protein